MEGNWTFSEGTGPLKETGGRGTYSGRPTESGKRMYSISGAWLLPKSTSPNH